MRLASFLSSLPPTCPRAARSDILSAFAWRISEREFSTNRHFSAYSNFRGCVAQRMGAPSTRGLRRSGVPFRAPSFFQPTRPSLLQLRHCPSQLRLSFPLLPTKSYPLLLVGRSVGRSAGWGKRESKDRECVRQESFSSSLMYSQDGSIETTCCSLFLSLSHTHTHSVSKDLRSD